MKTLSNILLILFPPLYLDSQSFRKHMVAQTLIFQRPNLKTNIIFITIPMHLSNRTSFSQFQADKCKQTQKLW